MADTQRFKYTDAEWNRIADEFPRVTSDWWDQLRQMIVAEADEDSDLVEIDNEYCRRDSPHVRRILEDLATEFIADLPIQNEAYESHKLIGPMLPHARIVIDHLKNYWATRDRFGPGDESAKTFGMPWHYRSEDQRAFLAKLLGVIDDLEFQARRTPENLADGRKARTLRRNQWLRYLLAVWLERGGTLGISTHGATGQPNGPTVRFLLAATEPVYRARKENPPSAQAIAEVIYASRGNFRPASPRGENSSD